MDIGVQTLDINGYIAKQESGTSKFLAPCIFYFSPNFMANKSNGSVASTNSKKLAPEVDMIFSIFRIVFFILYIRICSSYYLI